MVGYILVGDGAFRIEYTPCLSEALGRLIEEGANKDAQFPREGRELRKSRLYKSAGEIDRIPATRGETTQRTDYVACGISFSDLHC